MVYYINRTAAEMAENVKGKNSIAVHYIKGRVYIGDDKKYIGGYNDVKKGFNAYVVCDGVAVYFQNDNSSCESYERFGTVRAAALAIAVAHIVGNAIASFIDAINASANWSTADEAEAADIAAEYELAEVAECIAAEEAAITATHFDNIGKLNDIEYPKATKRPLSAKKQALDLQDEEAYFAELTKELQREQAEQVDVFNELAIVYIKKGATKVQVAEVFRTYTPANGDRYVIILHYGMDENRRRFLENQNAAFVAKINSGLYYQDAMQATEIAKRCIWRVLHEGYDIKNQIGLVGAAERQERAKLIKNE